MPPAPNYRFGEFVLCPARRELRRNGAPVSLIPKYFDLLCLLVERRSEALGRQVIFDAIWPDVVVSESALTQAIRTLRRVLEDSPREPRYIRTVSRHGYQFVFTPVIAEPDAAEPQPSPAPAVPAPESTDAAIDELVAQVLGAGRFALLSDDERLDAATGLHALGTERALSRIAGQPGSERARALLRQSRWDVEGAGDVPILTAPGPLRTVAALVQLRARDAARGALRRLGAAAAGGGLAGVAGGVMGGLALLLAAGSPARGATVTALAIIGGTAGLFGAGVVGAGLAAAEVLARSQRRLALMLCGTISGIVAAWLARLAIEAVFGSLLGQAPRALGGPLEGAVVGCAAGCGYAMATSTPPGGGMATPRGRDRVRTALITGLCCTLAVGALGALGGRTVSVTLDELSLTYDDAQVGLAPLAPFLGEQELRPLTRAAASGFEGLLFGFGLAYGLTRRPPGRNSR